jgi:putative hydrolase of the HAD superfamily
MSRALFAHVETWVFDLDNTLYPPAVRLFDQIEARMTAYVMRTLAVDADRANAMRDHYWHTHGTTLAGLMREHGLDPEPYLAEVHDIDLTGVAPAPALRAAIGAPSRRRARP